MCSYSYDVTHTLQFNMTAYNLQMATSAVSADQSSAQCQFWQTDVDDDRVVHDSSCAERDVEDASCVLQAELFADDAAPATSSGSAAVDNSDQIDAKHGRVQDSPASTDSKTLFLKHYITFAAAAAFVFICLVFFFFFRVSQG